MKLLQKLAGIISGMVVLLTLSTVTYAVEFDVESLYESVFVVYSGNSMGSGFAIGDNCIVTNAHVVEDQRNIEIATYSEEQYDVFLVAMDEELDIAILGVEGASFTPLKVAAEELQVGDDVYALGVPNGMSYTLTKGIISAKDREMRRHKYIQIDAAINTGNSGGPSLNENGYVIGVNTLKLSDSEGIGLAIPMDVVCEFLKEQGIETDENGNVTGEMKSEDYPAPYNSPKETTKAERSFANATIPDNTVLVVLLIGSVMLNVILIIVCIFQKKKKIPAAYDPTERTDFEIDIWE